MSDISKIYAVALSFDTLDLEIFVICWIESVDPVDDFVSDKPNLFITAVNAFEFKEITEVHNAHLKMLLEDDETRPPGCSDSYPTTPCALAEILPETTVHA